MSLSTSGLMCFLSCQLVVSLSRFDSVEPSESTDYYESCNAMKMKLPNAPSGEYDLKTKNGSLARVYCEMGLHGGGYTFLHPQDLTWLTDAEVQHMFTIKTTFLMRIRKTDGSQPYAVLSQLSQYSSTPLMIGLNHNTYYNDPQNKASLSNPYLYFGFLPKNIANRANAQQGITVNFFANTYNNCGGNPNNYIALFPNFEEILPTNYLAHATFPFCNTLFAKHQINPSRRVMPGGYFMFAELHFGGCGCYSQIGRIPDVLSAAIGFK